MKIFEKLLKGTTISLNQLVCNKILWVFSRILIWKFNCIIYDLYLPLNYENLII